MKIIIPFLLLFISLTVSAQKKVLDHSDYELWSTIEGDQLAPNGKYVVYALAKGEKDHFLKIKDIDGRELLSYDRGKQGLFGYDSKHLFFTIKPWKDSLRAMKSRKVKKKNLPNDSLGIFNLENKSLTKIGNLKSYTVPEKWSGYVAYMLEEVKTDNTSKSKDSVQEKKPKKKNVSKENGYHVVLRNLEDKTEDTLKFVTHYTFSKKDNMFAYSTTGPDKDSNSSVVVMDLENEKTNNIHSAKSAKYFQLEFSETGRHLGFVVDADTTKVQIRPNELFLWKKGAGKAEKLVDSSSAPKDYFVSSDGKVHFSKDESKLFFGLRKPPVIKDTTLTDDEIVNVEVWTYNEPRLYTVQELQLKNDTIRSFETVIHLKDNKLVQLANTEFTESELGDEGNAAYTLIGTSTPYELESQWKGFKEYDYAVLDVRTGETVRKIKKSAQIKLSPQAKYAYGYSRVDTTWFTHDMKSGIYKALTKDKVFYNEFHDYPDHPYAYGVASFTKDDASVLLYDRYDIWEFNPKTGEGNRLTKGRETKTRYRLVQLDKEERSLNPDTKWLFTVFDETTKNSGYVLFNPKNQKLTKLVSGPYRYSNPKKAVLSEQLLFTRESFKEFPNLRTTDFDFENITVLSDANPQQSGYNWGTNELINWTSLDGKELTGMLIKPENFDPNKKYPLLVNFYERSSDGLHRHRIPRAERSSINYSFYTSRGYIIFNPDVAYRVGYPGESAYNCVIPGVTSLIEKGFIDKDNIGVQGHSWGGYQIAYLVTKTDIFKAAESGAPVPNMISAYGGIRWWTGLSRQFQYEHTQSRIGGTPWEYPARYIENSPIFNIDKINTPLLVMHNDADGHVPWSQGIEFFVSLRRLGKPSWFLNYNGEPHWPLKLQNRKDFNLRMAQFFDYYLKGAPKPVWMEKGVPALEKGVNQGYELMDSPE